MIAVSQYKVAQLTPDDCPSLDQVQDLGNVLDLLNLLENRATFHVQHQ